MPRLPFCFSQAIFLTAPILSIRACRITLPVSRHPSHSTRDGAGAHDSTPATPHASTDPCRHTSRSPRHRGQSPHAVRAHRARAIAPTNTHTHTATTIYCGSAPKAATGPSHADTHTPRTDPSLASPHCRADTLYHVASSRRRASPHIHRPHRFHITGSSHTFAAVGAPAPAAAAPLPSFSLPFGALMPAGRGRRSATSRALE